MIIFGDPLFFLRKGKIGKKKDKGKGGPPVLLNPHEFTGGGGGASNTVLLTHFDGVDGATSSTDSSPSGHTLTFNSGAQIDDAQSKFGGSSLLLSGGGYVSVSSSDDFHFGSDPFCVEMFMRPSSVSTFGRYIATKGIGWILSQQPANLVFQIRSGGTTHTVLSSAAVLSANTWQHVAATFDGTKYRMFHNGVMVASSTTVRAMDTNTSPLRIGTRDDLSGDWSGHVDEFRITKGDGVYTDDGGFTPPTAAF